MGEDGDDTLLEAVTKDLLEGFGATDDHKTFIAALVTAGMTKETATEVMVRIIPKG